MPDLKDHADEAGGSGLLALLVVDGALLGAFALAMNPLTYGAVPVPVGALLSILILPWLVLRAGEVDPRPQWAGAPAYAWFAVLAIFGFTGPGGDVLLSGTWPPLALIVGGVGAALWALRRLRTSGGSGGTR